MIYYIGDMHFGHDNLKSEMAAIEIPSKAEGFDHVYIVTEGEIKEVIEVSDASIVERSLEELALEEEREKIMERKRYEKQALIEQMEQEGFWHYCEVCGKRELLTSQQAFDDGWDYPGINGIYKTIDRSYGFGMLLPRTCGKSGIDKTLWMRLMSGKSGVAELSDTEREMMERIKNEPESLMREKGEAL